MSGAAQKERAVASVHQDNKEPSSKTTQGASSADDGAAAAASDGGGNQDEQNAPGGSERAAGSPEPNCAICLGALENKSFTDSCFHMFCFVCLQEWSKVKPECPLCKQPFKSIIHNVKSYNNYDQFYLDHPRPAPQPLPFGWNFERPSFHYRTTLTMDHRYYSLLGNRGEPSLDLYRRPSLLPHYRLRSRVTDAHDAYMARRRTTTEARRRIYDTGRRVSGVRTAQRARVVNPEFYRRNPAQTHRLVPWLNRELNALLYDSENQVTFVMELIMDLIKRFPIDSEEFYQHISPYLHHHTRHFMHEFLSFARSPLTMPHYDGRAVYEEPSHTVSSPDSSSSAVVVVDDDDEEEERRERRWDSGAQPNFLLDSPSLRLVRSGWNSPPSLGLGQSRWNSPSPGLGQSRWDSPTPGPSWDLGGNSSQSPVNVDDSSDSDASTIINPAYITPEHSSGQPARSASPDLSDPEDVIFVSYDKPWEERSPIQLSSDSDKDEKSFSHFVKALKQEHKRKKKLKTSQGNSGDQERSRHRDRSGSLTPPVHFEERSRSHHKRHGGHDRDASSRGKSKHHKKRRHQEDPEGVGHLSKTSRREKRKHSASTSTSHSRIPPKRRNQEEKMDEEEAGLDPRQKKHKHKKHKKTKDKSGRHSKRQHNQHLSGTPHRAAETATSATATDRVDHCKKHPSGHKKSRVEDTDQGNETGLQEGNSSHHSDGLLSDTSTSSSSSTVTTASLTDGEATSTHFSRQQRVQQVLEERQRQACHFPVFPSLDMASSWESLSMLAGLLSSHTPITPVPHPGPSQSSDDPVVISTSDESDLETSGPMNVAKTVVVPCSTYLGVPASAVEFPSTSTSVSKPLEVDTPIDVDSISSDDEVSDSEVVDVESLADTEDSCIEPCAGQKTHTCSADTVTISEISTESDNINSSSTQTRAKSTAAQTSTLPFSIQSILGGDIYTTSGSQASTSSVGMPSCSKGSAFTHSSLYAPFSHQNGQAPHTYAPSILSRHWQGSDLRVPLPSLFSQQTFSHTGGQHYTVNRSRADAALGSSQGQAASLRSSISSDVNCLTDTEDELLGRAEVTHSTFEVSDSTESEDVDVLNDSLIDTNKEDISQVKQNDPAQEDACVAGASDCTPAPNTQENVAVDNEDEEEDVDVGVQSMNADLSELDKMWEKDLCSQDLGPSQVEGETVEEKHLLSTSSPADLKTAEDDGTDLKTVEDDGAINEKETETKHDDTVEEKPLEQDVDVSAADDKTEEDSAGGSEAVCAAEAPPCGAEDASDLPLSSTEKLNLSDAPEQDPLAECLLEPEDKTEEC